MRDLVKLIYRGKIKLMFYFQLGYGEVSNLLSMAKDIAILVGFGVVVFKFQLSVKNSILIGIGSFAAFTLLGVILKASGMSDYATKMSNSVNPELKLINKIAKKLGVKDEPNPN